MFKLVLKAGLWERNCEGRPRALNTFDLFNTHANGNIHDPFIGHLVELVVRYVRLRMDILLHCFNLVRMRCERCFQIVVSRELTVNDVILEFLPETALSAWVTVAAG